MHRVHRLALAWLLTAPLGASLATAQDPTAEPLGPPSPEEYTPPSQKLEWPRDRNRPVCVVAGKRHSLQDVLTYLGERHAPLTLKTIDGPSGRALLESPRMPVIVRQYADIRALEAEAELLGVARETIDKAVSASLKHAFEAHLEDYTKRRAQQGRPVTLDQRRINILLEHFQNREGLRTELEGWLDALVPATPLEADGILRDYYREQAILFGGRVTFSHILVRHRDPQSGELMIGDGAREAIKRTAAVQNRLADDGSNFEDVARVLSEDRLTAERGGILEDVARFDTRLPAALCRAAWELRDGQFTDVPIESPYGFHFVKRISYRSQYYVYYHQDLKPEIIDTKRKQEKEDLLWRARSDHRVKLLF